MSERELDFAVAEKVMGEPCPQPPPDCDDPINDLLIGNAWIHTHCYDRGDVCEIEPRPFSTNPNDANAVLNRMRSLYVGVRVELYQHYSDQVFVEMNVRLDNVGRGKVRSMQFPLGC